MSDLQEHEKKLADAFEMMWGKYPDVARLIRRGFNVVAANDVCKSFAHMVPGYNAGVKCNGGDPADHRGCRAMLALKSNEAQCYVEEREGMKITSYWLPIAGEADYFVHFSTGCKEYLDKHKNDN